MPCVVLEAGGGEVGAGVRVADLAHKVVSGAAGRAVVPDAAVADALLNAVDHDRARFAEGACRRRHEHVRKIGPGMRAWRLRAYVMLRALVSAIEAVWRSVPRVSTHSYTGRRSRPTRLAHASALVGIVE